jgi:phage-related protein
MLQLVTEGGSYQQQWMGKSNEEALQAVSERQYEDRIWENQFVDGTSKAMTIARGHPPAQGRLIPSRNSTQNRCRWAASRACCRYRA